MDKIPTDQQIASKLMNREVFETLEYTSPYIFESALNDQKLIFFGANHSRDPSNFQYPILAELWKTYSERFEPHKCIVLVEGGKRFYPEPTLDEAVINGSEGSFISYLAFEKKIRIECPEPSRDIINTHLERSFSLDEIQYYYFARVVHQWSRFLDKPSFDDYIDKCLKHDEIENGWQNYDYSFTHMMNLHKKFFRTKFDYHDSNFFYSHINPFMYTSVINEVSYDEGRYRDIHIVKEILKYLSLGLSPFAVFGSGHAVVQEQALKDFITFQDKS